MRKCLLVLSITMISVFTVWAATAAHAQTAPPANRDLSGVWVVKQAAKLPWAPNTNRAFAVEVPLQPWAQEHCRFVGCARGVRFTGEPGGNAYLIGEDPAYRKCAPVGFPRILLNGDLMEMLQLPNRVFMRFYRNNEMREIWTDGRGHPEDFDLTWMGHSIGRWDGDTFVIDTVGIYGGDGGKYKWLDEAGYPHSDELHVTERIRRTSPNSLEFDLTFEDPKAFTAPVQARVIYDLRPDEQIMEYIRCEDRIFAEGENEAWPFFSGEYPMPHVPAVDITQ